MPNKQIFTRNFSLIKSAHHDDKNELINQNELINKLETHPLIILGQAGLGKTELLKNLEKQNATLKYCTARQLINRTDPKSLLGSANFMIIDALDEVNAASEKSPLDAVLQQLGRLNYPNFILSCRSADWQNTIGIESIKEQYNIAPFVFRLEPLSHEDALDYLTALLVDTNLIKKAMEHFFKPQLKELLGNPQTLNLISEVIKNSNGNNLPKTLTELYEQACAILCIEHKDSKSELEKDEALDLAGVAFACLILTNNGSIAQVATANKKNGDLTVNELAKFVTKDKFKQLFNTRLVNLHSSDHFIYLHRSIGEYLAAKWLIKKAKNHKHLNRLFAVFYVDNIVPSYLRGLHAWLAQDPMLANEIIKKDPMGFLEYGDRDSLTIANATTLLKSLGELAARNIKFVDIWRVNYSIKGFDHEVLYDDIIGIITNKSLPFSYRCFIIQSISKVRLIKRLIPCLQSIVMDKDDRYSVRSMAGKILAEVLTEKIHAEIIESLLSYKDSNANLLAIEFINNAGIALFDNALIAKTIICFYQDPRDDYTLNILKHSLLAERGSMIIKEVMKQTDANSSSLSYELKEFIHDLIYGYVPIKKISPNELVNWINYFGSNENKIFLNSSVFDEYLTTNSLFRKQVQRVAMLENHHATVNAHDIIRKFKSFSTIFFSGNDDMIDLLDHFNYQQHSNEMWRNIVRSIKFDHDHAIYQRIKQSASNITENLVWLDFISLPTISYSDPQIENNTSLISKTRVSDQLRYNQYTQNILNGEPEYLIKAAAVYLGYIVKIKNPTKKYGNSERLIEWLGEEITKNIIAGFNQYLVNAPQKPDVNDIVNSYLESKQCAVSYITLSALAEKNRLNSNFKNVSNHQLMIGLATLYCIPNGIEHNLDIFGLVLEQEIIDRNCYSDFITSYYLPLLKSGRSDINQLKRLFDEGAKLRIVLPFILNCLKTVDNLSLEVTSQFFLYVTKCNKNEHLIKLINNKISFINDEHRRLWSAFQMLIDFERFKNQLTKVENDLLLDIKKLTDSISRRYFYDALTIQQAYWIISSFRMVWNTFNLSSVTSSGNSDFLHAREYIVMLINKIGTHVSIEATTLLRKLVIDSEDNYTEIIKTALFEQNTLYANAHHRSIEVKDIYAIINDDRPSTIVDLQAYIFDELKIVQSKISSDDVDSWRGFYNDQNLPFNEERCRDHLVSLLRQNKQSIIYSVETHVGNDREVDITCSIGGSLRLPLEIKGQWHNELWAAVDNQLDRFYTQDWQADNRGIYLILWFGENVPHNKKMKGLSKGIKHPDTLEQIKRELARKSPAVQSGRVKIFVLDLRRDFK